MMAMRNVAGALLSIQIAMMSAASAADLPTSSDTPSTATPKTAAATGTITGTVVYRADPQRPWRLGRYYVKDAKSGFLAEAVVAIRDPRLKIRNDSPKTVVVDQLNFQFSPETVALQAGDSVRFTNSDSTLHNVKTDNGTEPFNINISSGDEHVQTFPRGTHFQPIALGCAYHGGMRGWIFVFDHPCFDLTGPSGKFELKNVPAGEHWLYLKHPAGGFTWKKKIEVPPGDTVEVDILLSPDDRAAR